MKLSLKEVRELLLSLWPPGRLFTLQTAAPTGLIPLASAYGGQAAYASAFSQSNSTVQVNTFASGSNTASAQSFVVFVFGY
jgi:hypothetical protein